MLKNSRSWLVDAWIDYGWQERICVVHFFEIEAEAEPCYLKKNFENLHVRFVCYSYRHKVNVEAFSKALKTILLSNVQRRRTNSLWLVILFLIKCIDDSLNSLWFRALSHVLKYFQIALVQFQSFQKITRADKMSWNSCNFQYLLKNAFKFWINSFEIIVQ